MTFLRQWVRLLPALFTLAVFTWPLQALATQIVSSTNDSGDGSLRQALSSAAAGEEIVFDANFFSTPHTIFLASALPAITNDLIITGPGAAFVTIDAQSNFAHFTVPTGVAVRISGVTLRHGNSGSHGGAVVNNGSLTLSDCVVSDSHSGADGGAVFNASTGTMTLYRCTFTGNEAATNGGAISNAGLLTVSLSTFYNNTLTGGPSVSTFGGGGLFNDESGVVSITRSTFAGNSGGLDGGGGIDTWGACNITNSIVSGNSSATETDFQAAHAQNLAKPVVVTNTLLGNATGIGIFANHGGPTATVNLLPGSNALNTGNELTTLTADVTQTGSALSVALASYIASTPGSYLIQIESEQMQVTSVNLASNLLTVQRAVNGTSAVPHLTGAPVFLVGDQRGSPVAGTPDIGAYEVQGFSISVVSGTPQSTTVNTPFANRLVVSVKDGTLPIEGAMVTFVAPAQSGASATFAGNVLTATSDSLGKATSQIVSANTISGGPYQVSASISGVAPVSFSLTNIPESGSITPNGGTTPQTTIVATSFATALSVTVKDEFGNVASNVEVTFTAPDSGASAAFGNGTNTIKVSTDNLGVATAPATANTVAGTYTVSASIEAGQSTSFLLTNTASAVTHFAILPPASTSAGTPFTFSLSALDQYANVNQAYAGTVHFTTTDLGPAAVLPADYTFVAADHGTHSFSNGAVLVTAGGQRILAADTASASITGDSGLITVNPAAASRLTVTAPASTVAGVAFDLAITALDPFGNLDTNYRGTVGFTTSDTGGSLPGAFTFAAADGGTHLFAAGATLRTAAQTATITATDSVTSNVTGSATLRVDPAATSHFAVTAPATATAGVTFSVTVTALDPFNNVVPNYPGTVRLISNTKSALLPPDATLTNGTGSFPVSITMSGSATVTAIDTASNMITGTSNGILVTGAAATHLQLTVPPSASVGAAFSFGVSALDQYGNVDTAYAGTLHFTSTDSSASLPADTVLPNGQSSFSATLNIVGNPTISASDSGSPTISGTSAPIPCTINVAPTLDPISDRPTIRKDQPTQTVPLTGIAAGASETQVLTITATSSNPALIPDPQITYISPATSGSLSFTSVKGKGGTATITVKVQDSGGTAAGGVDSITRSFTVTIDATNVVPSFVINRNLQLAQNAGPQAVDGFATAIKAGPPDESNQVLTFQVTTDRPELFSTPPAITKYGTLTFTPSLNSSGGTATVSVQLHDDGGTDGGGQDTSAPQTFKIAITSLDQAIGTFRGLVQPDPTVTASNDQVGVITVTVGKKGAFTGQLKLAGRPYPLRGSFDNTGAVHFGTTAASQPTLALPRPGLPTLQFSLQLDLTGGTDKITGALTLPNAAFALVDADRALYTAKKNPVAPFQNVPPDLLGKYTVVFAPKSAADQGRPATEFPQGYGIGTVVVSANGIARLSGTLADGTPVGCSSTLSKTNHWPFYVALAGGKGSISAPVAFRNVDQVSDLDAANVLWFKPATVPAQKRYPAAWPSGIKVDLVGSKLTIPAPTSTDPLLPGLTATDTDGNAELDLISLPDGTLAKALNLGPKTKVTVLANTERVTFALNPLFTGTFVRPPAKARTVFHGVVFQKQKSAFGFFLTATESGTLVVIPKDHPLK